MSNDATEEAKRLILDWANKSGADLVEVTADELHPDFIAHIAATLAARDEEIAKLKGAMEADDERLKEAAITVWGEHVWGCDTADHMADLVLYLRAQLAEAENERDARRERKLTCENLTAEVLRLESDLERLKDILAAKEICLMDLYDERDAAEIKGMERARGIVALLKPGYTVSVYDGKLLPDKDGPWGLPVHFANAIDAEIAKPKEEK